jgi:hypothetical protein
VCCRGNHRIENGLRFVLLLFMYSELKKASSNERLARLTQKDAGLKVNSQWLIAFHHTQ